jgi:hypothetical protein
VSVVDVRVMQLSKLLLCPFWMFMLCSCLSYCVRSGCSCYAFIQVVYPLEDKTIFSLSHYSFSYTLTIHVFLTKQNTELHIRIKQHVELHVILYILYFICLEAGQGREVLFQIIR